MTQPWEGFPLSRQQEYVLGLVGGGRAVRTVARAALAATTDRSVLEDAVRDVVAAHESLRTGFREVPGDNSAVLMVIQDDPKISVTDAAGDDTAISELIRRELHTRPESEGRGGSEQDLPRLVLFNHTATAARTLLVSAHRACMDEASVEIFFHDLQQAYAARMAGGRWQPENLVQYADYAQWQIEQGTPTGPQKRAEAGRQARVAALPLLNLPLEIHSDATGYEDLTWTVPAPLADRLRGLAADVPSGLCAVLLTGWFAAIWHAADRPESLAVAATLTRRPFQEMTTAIGCFQTPMPIFVEGCENLTLAELLRSVDADLRAGEHAEESTIQPARQHAGGLPGFAFADLGARHTPAAPPLCDLRLEPSDDGRKVGLAALASDTGIRLTLRRQVGRLADGGAEALAACLRATLSALAEDPLAAVATLAMLAEQAAGDLVAATNHAEPPIQPEAHWHRRVEHSAQRTPQATALRSAARSWTYHELDEAANRLAHALIARGTRPGTLVGLYLERCDLAIVAMLAIAKAGCGYVPIDPHLPPRRRAAIEAAVGFTHVVATAENAPHAPQGVDILVLDAHLSVCRGHSAQPPDVATSDNDPAYALFTSGSTGLPKGVLVSHGNLAAYLEGVWERLGLSGAIDAVALGALSTDLGNTALFTPLHSSGQLLVVEPEVSADAKALGDLLAREEYDLIKITPSHLAAVISEAQVPEKLMPRKALVLGGEALTWGWFNLFSGFLGQCQLYNHYGPTETTVGVLCGRATMTDLSSPSSLTSTVPVGTPMRHARAYILDPQRRPVPAGVAGELWIGGSSVSLGYLSGTADNQEQRFQADPFSPVAGARMYRTGDKVRLLPDRTIEFRGRVDRQIKMRGFRVELGEIESVMRRHPRVKDSVVVEAGQSTAAHLVGYVTDTEGSHGSAEWLREFLAERLPEFMMPVHLVALDAFPLTGTGKIDSAMLPDPALYSHSASSYIEPRTPTERRIAAAMAELLLLNQVGAEDDFFDIGGHSLLAVQLAALLRGQFQVNVKLRTLFERPVVAELAESIDQLLAKQAGTA